MGLYDRIQFDEPHECPNCGKKIKSIQTKKFGKVLDTYRVGDRVDHAEETRISGEGTYCRNCSEHLDNFVYLVVERGILIGIADTRKEAEEILSDFSEEKLVFMYHDLYSQLKEAEKEKGKYRAFLEELVDWFGEHSPKEGEMSDFRKISFTKSRYLENASTPLRAVQDFLAHQRVLEELDKLEGEKDILEIYWLEDIRPGRKKWSVDVMNDELNDRCGMNWTWTVISEVQLEEEDRDIFSMTPWNIRSEEGYSDSAVEEAVRNWLDQKGYSLDVKVIPPEETEGSGYVEKLEELSEKDLKSERYVSLEDWEKDSDE